MGLLSGSTRLTTGRLPAEEALLHRIPYHHARTRAITRDTVLPGNQAIPGVPNASRNVAGVVSDVSVLCPRAVDDIGNRGWTLEPHEEAFRELKTPGLGNVDTFIANGENRASIRSAHPYAALMLRRREFQ